MSKRIRVKEDTHTTLARLNGDEETCNELRSRLISKRCETIQRGDGLWGDTDAAEKIREEMKRGVGTR